MSPSATIVSPLPTGSGAIVLHRQLERLLPSYRVVPYSPRREWFPPLVGMQRLGGAAVVHTAPDHAPFLARRGKPLVITFHNLVVDAFMRPYSTAIQRLHYATDLRWWIQRALRRADAVTAVSRFTADLVRQEFGFQGTITVIPNGVDTERFSPQPKPPRRSEVPLRVLFSGNLSRRKGAHWLGAIAEKLPEGVDLVCASGLRSGSAAALHPRVKVLGRIPYDEMVSVYRSADVFIFPTVREGMSLALLEAMACGLPVVASDCSSNPELIQAGEGGLLCPVGDVDAFADAVRRLAESADLRAYMGERNREWVLNNHKLTTMAQAYASVFAAFGYRG